MVYNYFLNFFFFGIINAITVNGRVHYFRFQMWHLTCVDDFLNRTFYKVGLLVGRHPGYFVIVPILLACICFTGYQRINYEIDPEYLFSPVNGPSKTERAIVEQYFKVNYSHQFNVGRITRPGESFINHSFCVVLTISSPTKNSMNLINLESF